MRFLFVSVSRNAAPWIERSLMSIATQQTDHEFTACIIDDASTDGADLIIKRVCEERGWPYFLNEERHGALRNQCFAIDALEPEPDDVIVIVDGDDRLAHDKVIERLWKEYRDPEVLLTYGSYKSEPHSPTCSPALPYPPEVIRDRSFRKMTYQVEFAITTHEPSAPGRSTRWTATSGSSGRTANGSTAARMVPSCSRCSTPLELGIASSPTPS